MNPKFVIKSKAGYVTGFSEEHQIVQVTDKAADAKRFTAKSADNFMSTYAEAGYGLGWQGTKIIPEDEAQDFVGDRGARLPHDHPTRVARREALAGVEAMQQPDKDGVQVVEVMDLTPTWSAVVPILIAALEVGTDKGVQSAEKELKRMARIMDNLIEERKELVSALEDMTGRYEAIVNEEYSGTREFEERTAEIVKARAIIETARRGAGGDRQA